MKILMLSEELHECGVLRPTADFVAPHPRLRRGLALRGEAATRERGGEGRRRARPPRPDPDGPAGTSRPCASCPRLEIRMGRSSCYHEWVMSPASAMAILAQRFAKGAADRERCVREIRAMIPSVADLLVRDFGVRKVVLFGSLARGDGRPDSDIDLAVEGLPPELTFRAMARAADIAGRHVDLVPLETARPEVLAIIEREGEVILGKNGQA